MTDTTRPNVATRLLAPFKAWWPSVRPGPGELRREAVSGLPGAIGSVPDGMASAVLAGVSPGVRALREFCRARRRGSHL